MSSFLSASPPPCFSRYPLPITVGFPLLNSSQGRHLVQSIWFFSRWFNGEDGFWLEKTAVGGLDLVELRLKWHRF